jgi:adenine-specific DNA-methyltransferase
LLALTNKGSWVLDPYAGVGSTLIACVKNQRNSIGIEKEEQYVKIAEKNIVLLKEGIFRTRPINKPIHVPSLNDKVAKVPDEWSKGDTA